MIELYPHQHIAKAKVLDRLKEYKCVYLMAQERFGKTHTVLSALQDIGCKNVLFVTVKNAIKGIQGDYTGNYNFNLQVINYESVLKFKGSYDAIVLDECFVKGTKVDNKNIEDYQSGDMVETIDGTKQKVNKLVVKDSPDIIMEISIANKKVFCTPTHKFFTINRGWVQAKDLNEKDMFKLQQ